MRDCRSDRELMEAACDGDASAFDVLVGRHWQRLVHYVDMSAGGELNSEDIVQESFMRAYLSRHSFRFDSEFSTWISTITRNEASRARGKKRTFRLISPTTPEMDEPEEILLWKERTRMIRDALKKLPRLQREAIELTRYGGHTCVEAAKILGTSDASVRAAVFKGQQNLKEWLIKNE